ncbi:hypothetical protein BZA02_11812 [Ruegeria sp. P4]|nr:hypothetical protein BZA02_11812 [Ruegeria sp. P4]
MMHESHLSDTPLTPPVALDMPIHAHWAAMAQAKGFTITDRVDDRYHLLLRCETCGGMPVISCAVCATLKLSSPTISSMKQSKSSLSRIRPPGTSWKL